MDNLKYLNALNQISGLGAQKMKLLMDFFENDAERTWKADAFELAKSGIPTTLAAKIAAERSSINPDAEWEKLLKENIKIATINDDSYPPLLREIPSSPFILYTRGNADFSLPMLAVVGSRKLTQYGEQVASQISEDLARAGLVIVSGLAFGIDARAHRGALKAAGKTYAVLGNSLDDKNIAPQSNFNLAHEILDNDGALISEFPVETSANVGTFPARNRIMAGMSLGTLVVEAAMESGSLITANLALEFNREVFSVPGNIFSPQSEGTNKLIKNGAKMVTCAKDVLEELRLEDLKLQETVKNIVPDSKEEEIILNLLSTDPTHIDTIRKLAKLDTSTVSSTLSIMEMKGMVKNVGGQNYIHL